MEMTEEMREFFRKQGARGGRKSRKLTTKKQLSKWGRQGAKAREAKKKAS